MANDTYEGVLGSMNEDGSMPFAPQGFAPMYPQERTREELIGEMAGFGGFLKSQQSQQGLGDATITMDPKKGITIKNLDPRVAQQFVDTQNKYQKALGSFGQNMEHELAVTQARKDAVTGSPLINVLGRFASNMAQAPGMSPVLQALGKTASDMNPTEETLSKQEMTYQQVLSEIAGKQMTSQTGFVDTFRKWANEDRLVEKDQALNRSRVARNRAEREKIANTAMRNGTGDFDFLRGLYSEEEKSDAEVNAMVQRSQANAALRAEQVGSQVGVNKARAAAIPQAIQIRKQQLQIAEYNARSKDFIGKARVMLGSQRIGIQEARELDNQMRLTVQYARQSKNDLNELIKQRNAIISNGRTPDPTLDEQIKVATANLKDLEKAHNELVALKGKAEKNLLTGKPQPDVPPPAPDAKPAVKGATSYGPGGLRK